MPIIDIHTHGIGGLDTKTSSSRQILKIAELHKANGTEEIIPTVYADGIDVMRLYMESVRKAMQKQEDNKDPKEAKILGAHLEGPFLSPKRSGALKKSAFTLPTKNNIKRLIEGYEDVVKIITMAPELDYALDAISAFTKMGIVVSMGHSDATYSEAENGFYAGAKSITHLFNAMRPIHHREPGIAGFGILSKDIFIEVIADPHHLHIKTLEMIFNLKPKDRIIIVSDSVKETKTSTSSAAITATSNKLIGGSLTVAETLHRLKLIGYDEAMLFKCISDNPRNLIEGAKQP
ncbi:N-acetylglucosamine-6-phosphate deacetylase [Candidatus Magnetoovum chiemensis]|nr:N-acetylglucosamine-6-phosphate deacetylase [Candidatus Magnetoovum chiemensis]